MSTEIKYTKDLTSTLVEFLKGKELSSDNITSAVVHVMLWLSKMSELSGEQKKQLTLQVLREYVKDEKLQLFIDTIVPSFIDTLIDVAKKKIDFKKITKCC